MALGNLVPGLDDPTQGKLPPQLQGLGMPAEPGPLPAMGEAPPLGPSSLKPLVTNPQDQLRQQLQEQVSKFYQPPNPQGFWGKLGHTLAQTGVVQNSGTMVARREKEAGREKELGEIQGQQLKQQEAASKAGLQSAQAGYYGQRGESLQSHEVTAEEASAMGLPQLEGSLMDPKKWEDLVKQQGVNKTKVETTGMQDTTKLSVADKTAANKAQPHITTMGKDGKSHIMERDPATGQYSIDRGIAPPSFGQVAGDIRFAPPVLDTAEGNAPRVLTANQFNRATAGGNQDRFMPAAAGEKALTRTALIEDIRGNINQVRDVLQNEKIEPFSADQRAKLAIAMGRGDKGAIDAMLTGEFIQSLSPAQQDYVVNLAQLVENGMAMRSVLGAGQGSDQLRDAIRRTIPTAANPSSEYGLKQLQAFEQVINRLERGVPAVKLGGENPNQPTGGGTIVQHSPSTGAYRYSTDGGKTWQTGQPSQK